MKEYLKGIVTGVVITVVGLTTAFAAGGIHSATFNNNQVIYNGQTLSLSQPMASIVKEGEKNASNYMPVRAVLEAMGFTVNWDASQNAVVITGGGGQKFDAETEKEIQEFTSAVNKVLYMEEPEIALALQEVQNDPGYQVMKEAFRRLDPITLIILSGADYQVWVDGGESLFQEVWDLLAE